MELSISEEEWQSVKSYLQDDEEKVAFFYIENSENSNIWSVNGIKFLEPVDYANQSLYGVELADHVRPQIISYALSSKKGIAEIHMHGGKFPAMFSGIDIDGLRSLAPHMLWRLRTMPYVALVLGSDDYDGLVWFDVKAGVQTIRALRIDSKNLMPTGLSRKAYIEATEQYGSD